MVAEMRNCELFDRYRDGELSSSQKNEFQRHLAGCEDCRLRRALLDNVGFVLRQEKIQMTDLADRIARKAFQKVSSWDSLIASWFPPRFALAAVCVALILCSLFWQAPENQQKVYAYENLLNQAESSNLADKLLTDSDSEFVLTLAQRGEGL